MDWSDVGEIRHALDTALSKYQWTEAAAVCDGLVRRIRERSPLPEPEARAVLAALRAKRQFALAARVAEACIRFGQNGSRVRRHYAQALIDQGLLLASEPILQTLATEPLGGDSQVAEAHGSLGRIYKQLYVEADRPASAYARRFFERALAEYLLPYRLDPAQHFWHGINVVALLHRGRADGIDVSHAPSPDDLARNILAALPSASTDPFVLATRLEACIALGRFADAERIATEYVEHTAADAFEFASTLRQLEQVWRLRADQPPGSTILPLLRAARLRHEGGALAATPVRVAEEIAQVREAAHQLEKVLGDDRMVTLRWYETGLLRTKSVARIERLNGKGHGTGWLVRAKDFFPPGFPGLEGSELLVVTNAHVINETGSGGALAPNDARAHFQGLGAMVELDQLVWSSPPDALDATFLTLKDLPPGAVPVPVFDKPVQFTTPPARLFIIGHPRGRDLELSLHDNLLLGCNDRLLHYRTPTEPGSSGSPVFEAEGWRAVGLHHAGGTFERLDGTPPPYQANEGITMLALKAGIAATLART
jgi:hypothetical protein